MEQRKAVQIPFKLQVSHPSLHFPCWHGPPLLCRRCQLIFSLRTLPRPASHCSLTLPFKRAVINQPPRNYIRCGWFRSTWFMKCARIRGTDLFYTNHQRLPSHQHSWDHSYSFRLLFKCGAGVSATDRRILNSWNCRVMGLYLYDNLRERENRSQCVCTTVETEKKMSFPRKDRGGRCHVSGITFPLASYLGLILHVASSALSAPD